ncbi:MAG: TetR/AcrR family transcriptional regulator [Actinomycetota bacterium]
MDVPSMRVTPPSPRRMSRADRRASLLDAAADLLRAPEPTPLSFDAIAAAANVSPTLPYKYFDSVDEVAAELHAHVTAPLDREVEAVLADPSGTFEDKVRITLRLWCDMLRRDGTLLLRLSDDVAHPSLRHAIEARRERSVFLWADEIARTTGLDSETARLVAGSITGGSIGALRRWIVDRLERDHMIETFVVLARAQLDAVGRH